MLKPYKTWIVKYSIRGQRNNGPAKTRDQGHVIWYGFFFLGTADMAYNSFLPIGDVEK
jgi:hypothetical protein